MSIRFKAVAAALGLIVAAGSAGAASADTIVKTTTRHGGFTKSVKIVERANRRVHVGTRLVDHVRIVRRGPVLVRPVLVRPAVVTVVGGPSHRVVFHSYGVKTYGVRTVTTRKIVRITRGPLQKHAMFHRIGGPTVVIR